MTPKILKSIQTKINICTNTVIFVIVSNLNKQNLPCSSKKKKKCRRAMKKHQSTKARVTRIGYQ